MDRRKDLMLQNSAISNVYNEKVESIKYKMPKNLKFYIREKDDIAVDAYEVYSSTFKKYIESKKYKPLFWISSN